MPKRVVRFRVHESKYRVLCNAVVGLDAEHLDVLYPMSRLHDSTSVTPPSLINYLAKYSNDEKWVAL